MRVSNSRRSGRLAAVTIGLLLIAAGVSFAAIPDSGGTYTACMLKNVGTVRLIDPSLGSTSLLGHCTTYEVQVAWSGTGRPGPAGPQGPAGKDGTSVTSAAVASGDANCTYGGSKFTAALGAISFACNGTPGTPGTPGTNGTNGTNGKDGISVTSAPEPDGTNCANGGSSFTSANRTTFACNGAPGAQGPQGPLPSVLQDTRLSYGFAPLTWATVASIKTPATAYPREWVLLGKIAASNNAVALDGTLNCQLVSPNGAEWDTSQQSVGASKFTTIVVTALFSGNYPSGIEFDLQCEGVGSPYISLNNVTLQAVEGTNGGRGL